MGKNRLEDIAISILNEEKARIPSLSTPGTFSEMIIEESPWSQINRNWHLDAEPTYSQDLIDQYKFFDRWIHSPKRVFYPCSELDASPIEGFPDAEVVIMDREEKSSYVMKKHEIKGYVQGDVLSYTPENPFDLVIILNPGQKSSDLTRHLIKGGFVLVNNWHNNASELLEDPNYHAIGTLDKDDKGYFLARDMDKLHPNQFATYLYVFKNRRLEAA